MAISHECDFPADVKDLPVVTSSKVDFHASSALIDWQVRDLVTQGLSLYDIDEPRLRELKPDIIVTQDTCKVCALSLDDVRAATCRMLDHDVQIISLAPLTLEDVFSDILRVADAAGTREQGNQAIDGLCVRLERLRAETKHLPRPRVLALEWLDPPMVIGHWSPDLIRIAGGEPILCHDAAPTRAVDWKTIADSQPDIVLLIPCGFKVEQTKRELDALMARTEFASLQAVKQGRVNIIDGNSYFNRPGPRLVDSAEIAATYIHPKVSHS